MKHEKPKPDHYRPKVFLTTGRSFGGRYSLDCSKLSNATQFYFNLLDTCSCDNPGNKLKLDATAAHIRALHRSLGDCYVREITNRVARQYARTRKTSGIPTPTIRRELSALARSLSIAIGSVPRLPHKRASNDNYWDAIC